MGTIVGVRAAGGVVLGGDERTTEGSTVTGRSVRVRSHEAVVAAAVGEPGDVDAFHREFEAELKRTRAEGESLSWDRITTVAGDLARDTGVDALVSARDDGTARLAEVSGDGGALETDAAARGSGMQVATGALESGSPGGLDDAEDLVRDALAAAADRDAESGDGIDVVRLTNAS